MDKLALYNHCVQLLQFKIAECNKIIETIDDSSKNEEKSSAGDKYETGRAMMQQEYDKVNNHMGQLNEMLARLKNNCPTNEISKTVNLGSLVSTNRGIFFIVVALGKVIYKESKIMVISPESPMSIGLMGKSQNDSVIVNGNTIRIVEIG